MIGMLLASNYSGPGEPVFRPAQMGYGLLPRLPSCPGPFERDQGSAKLVAQRSERHWPVGCDWGNRERGREPQNGAAQFACSEW
jgi:hypothetical protein